MSRNLYSNCAFNQICLPFAHFGLGKINNYIEDFRININKEKDNNNTWNPIIPNS